MAKATIIVSPSTLSLEVGSTATLVASLADGTIIGATWSSSNKAKVYVGRDTGLVTALVASTETITATYHGVKSTCKVTAVAAPVTDLTITCPGDQTVTGTGALTVVKLGPIQTSGGVAPIVVTFQPPVGTAFPIGTTLVTATAVSADQQRATCQYNVTVTGSFPAPPGPLTITCPLPVEAFTPDGDPVAVTFAATTTGGTAPVTIAYSPDSGSAFAIGTTGVLATATSTDGQTAVCSFTVTVKDASDSALRGPQATILCLVGSVRIAPGASIQAAINASPAGTKFCLGAGVHTVTTPLVPKSGNSFIGEYGAIMDGTGWTSSNPDDAAFKSINAGITGITIKNLEIRDMPQNAVKVYDFGNAPTAWIVENCYIHHNGCKGVVIAQNGIVRNNILTYNGDGGSYGGNYESFRGNGSLWDNNEISYGSNEQKVLSSNVTFRRNWVHHQRDGVGIWFDTAGTGGVIEDNIVEDNPYDGIMYEATGAGIIRNNIVRRNGFTGGNGIYISISEDVEIYGNTLEDNFRAITLFIECSAIASLGHDLRNNSIHNNSIRVSASPVGQLANQMITANSCSDNTPYTTNAKNNNFATNTYLIPTAMSASSLWTWGATGVHKTWTTWQAIPQDADGTRTLY